MFALGARNHDLELVFDGKHDLDDTERIDRQVGQSRFRRERSRIDVEVRLEYLRQSLERAQTVSLDVIACSRADSCWRPGPRSCPTTAGRALPAMRAPRVSSA